MLKHAKDHLDREGDTDRRIALIGFDQTIEVCIDVFLKLHPKLRAGVQIEGDEKHRALRSFYSKIEFLEGHLETKDFDLGIPVEELVWFHTLRNEIYHSGNGMVPERKVVEDAYLAATKVYEAINVFKFFKTPENLMSAIGKLEEVGRRCSWLALVPPSSRQRLPEHTDEQCSRLEQVGAKVEMVGRQVEALLKQAPDEETREQIKGAAFQLREAVAQSWNELDAVLGDATSVGDEKQLLAAAESARLAVLTEASQRLLRELSELSENLRPATADEFEAVLMEATENSGWARLARICHAKGVDPNELSDRLEGKRAAA